MANKKARLNDKDGGTVSSLQTIRVPIFGEEDYQGDSYQGGTVFGSAQYFQNVYLETLETKATQQQKIRAVKRPGLLGCPISNPGSGAVAGLYGRGIYYWNQKLFSVWGTRIYIDSTLVYTGLNSSTDSVSFCETHPDATTQYLCINDGTSLYLIDTSNNVLVMNNVVVSTSSVAVSSVITTATAHGLATGNRVIIRNHTGSTPSINNTIYTVTVLSPTTFSIPVNVTVAGTGGTIGVFPGNVGSLEFLDGYMFVGTVAGRIYNCDFNDPTTWNTTSYITAQMQNDDLVGLGKQNNYIVVFKEKTIQFFYDKGDNIVGQTPLANVEQSMQQIGCWSRQSIVSNTNTMFWVGNSRTGEATVFKLDGASNIKEIGIPYITRILEYNSLSITSVRGTLITINGNIFYTIGFTSGGLSPSGAAVFNNTNETWTNWYNNDSTINTGAWPISWIQTSPTGTNYKYLLGQDWFNGNIYNLSPLQGLDNGTSITVKVSVGPIDLDTNKRKFWERIELLITNLNTAIDTITLNYTDNINIDVNYLPQVSVSWTSDTNDNFNRFWKRANGNSRKRIFGFTHVGASINTKYAGFEMDVRISEF